MISLRKRSFVFLTISCLLLSLLMPFSAFARVTGASVLVFDPATNTISGVVYSTQPALTVDAEYSSGTPVHVYQTQSYTGGSKQSAPAFQDAADISSWAAQAVAADTRLGLISGYPDGRFYPQKNATRAESAVMLKHLLQAVHFMNS